MQLDERYSKHYSESKFWGKLAKIARKAGSQLIYNALLLYYVMLDRQVSLKSKAIIIAALGYLIFPFDTIPDIIPALGLSDDLTALLMVADKVRSSINPGIETKAKEKAEEIIGTPAPTKN